MKSWPNIYKHQRGFMVDSGLNSSGKRVRKFFSTQSAAKREASRLREERDRGLLGALALTNQELMDAVAAKRILAGTGISLESLAKAAVETGKTQSMTVEELFKKYLDYKKTAGIRIRSLKNIEVRVGRFVSDFKSDGIGIITAEMIDAWLKKQRWSPVSRNTHLNAVRTFFRYGVKNQWIDRNPAEFVDMSKASTDLPFVYSVEAVTKILRWLEKNSPESVPYYAVAFFSGIRPDEIRRLAPDNFSDSDGIITVSGQTSKTRHVRHVDIQPNLSDWLKAYATFHDSETTIYWSRRVFRRMTDDLKLEWGHDVARKSFVSYHLAAFRDQHETALQAGHRDTSMIYTVYRNITTTDGQKITKDYAADYWKILPEKKDALHPEAKKGATTRKPNRKRASRA